MFLVTLVDSTQTGSQDLTSYHGNVTQTQALSLFPQVQHSCLTVSTEKR